ncbi:MAG: DNA-protecting protein DprA, partial [Proteobacteria bacterium]|nr:DNA-protecting protein DprA [Pseudomonadota bacterium]
MTQDLPHWLALSFCQGIGPRTTAHLLSHFKDIQSIFQACATELKSLKLSEEAISQLLNPDWKQAEEALKWQEQPNHHIITWADEAYPKRLLETASSPPLLYIHGSLGLLNSPGIAIVGSRHPSPMGKSTALKMAYLLAKAGLTITSGIAQGIDGSAHTGALEAKGSTIAVMGTGLYTIYPRSHRKLAEKIGEQEGALVSEFPLNMPPHAKNFPIRNRIISGLSLGTLVVEANIKSGSLITARYANEQGREIFAIPGSINNPLTKGCHFLIQQGAKLVETADDVLEELKPLFSATSTVEISKPSLNMGLKELDNQQQKLVKCLGFEMMGIDALVEQCRLSTAEITALLVRLELEGYVKSVP